MNNTQIKAIESKLYNTVNEKIKKDNQKLAASIQKKIQTKLDKIYKLNTEKRKLEKEVSDYLSNTDGSIYFLGGDSQPYTVTTNYKHKHPQETELKNKIKDFIFELTIDDTDALKRIENFTQSLLK